MIVPRSHLQQLGASSALRHNISVAVIKLTFDNAPAGRVMTLDCSSLTLWCVVDSVRQLRTTTEFNAYSIGATPSGSTAIQSAATVTSTTAANGSVFSFASELSPYGALNQTAVTSNATSNLYVLIGLVALFVIAAVINNLVRYFRRRNPTR
jgi:hypothetical protein